MKRNLVGVMAVSIAALLFAGCSDCGSRLSPAQKERCDALEGYKKEIEAGSGSGIKSALAENLKMRAEAGC